MADAAVHARLARGRLRRRRGASATGLAVRPLPGAAQHAAGSGLDAEGAGGAAVGPPRRGALPDLARHGADRAVDGAPRSRPASSSRASSTSAASISASRRTTSSPSALSAQLNGYDEVRLHALVRAGRARAGRQSRVSRASRMRRCRCSPAATGATTCTSRGSRRTPDIDNNSRFNKVGPGYFRTLGMTMLAGRDFTGGRRDRRAEGGRRQRGLRQEVQPRARRRRQAHVDARPRRTSTRRSSGS